MVSQDVNGNQAVKKFGFFEIFLLTRRNNRANINDVVGDSSQKRLESVNNRFVFLRMAIKNKF